MIYCWSQSLHTTAALLGRRGLVLAVRTPHTLNRQAFNMNTFYSTGLPYLFNNYVLSGHGAGLYGAQSTAGAQQFYHNNCGFNIPGLQQLVPQSLAVPYNINGIPFNILQQQQFHQLHTFNNSEHYHPRPQTNCTHNQAQQQRHSWTANSPDQGKVSRSSSTASLNETIEKEIWKQLGQKEAGTETNPDPDNKFSDLPVKPSLGEDTSKEVSEVDEGYLEAEEDKGSVSSSSEEDRSEDTAAELCSSVEEQSMHPNRGVKRHPALPSGQSPTQKRPRSEEREAAPQKTSPNQPPPGNNKPHQQSSRTAGPRAKGCLSHEKSQKVTEVIVQYCQDHLQKDELYALKMQLRDALYAIMKDVFPYCGLYVVGSSMNAFGSNNSDMDLCLMISHLDIDQKCEATEFLRVIMKALRKCKFLTQLNLIRAKVPILKFRDHISGVECDLNINNSVGIRNTHLLNAYSKMDWRVGKLVLFIKFWAKCHNINDASQGSISSYSLVLMVIHYLQCGADPPVVPSLQQKFPNRFDANLDIRVLTLNDSLPLYTSQNDQSLGELFTGFLHYYANVFVFERDAITVRLGRRVRREMVTQQNPRNAPSQWKFICIEEPFDLSNTARSVYDLYTFRHILSVFRKSYGRLRATGDVTSILYEPL